MRKIILFLMILNIFSYGLENKNKFDFTPPIPLPPEISDPENPNDDFKIPDIKTSGEDIDNNELRYLEKTYTVMMEAKVNVFILLEVITDIDLETTLIENQIKEIPFDIELNRKPEKQNYYSIKYSETVLDIDGDGKSDTYIFSPKYINERISKDNYVKIYGENISKEGKHKKTVYITIEVGE